MNVRNRDGKHHTLELALYLWVIDMYRERVNLSHFLNKPNATRLQDQLNKQIEEDMRICMKFSDGWISNFQRRWNLCSFKPRGKVGDTDEKAAAVAIPSLNLKLAKFLVEGHI